MNLGCITPIYICGHISEQKKINREIEEKLKKEKQVLRRELKILLMGTADSGKSTFIKHMKIIHGDGYSDKEKQEFIKFIDQDIFKAIGTLIDAMDKLQIQYADSSNIERAKQVKNINNRILRDNADPYLVEAIKALWSDAGTQECYNRRREYQLTDSAKYFLDDLDRISSPHFLPTEQDILAVRVPTDGIQEHVFEVDSTIFRMIDMGEIRGERRKWIHHFAHPTSILFFVSLGDYDKTSDFDNENCMEKAMTLFGAMVASPWFLRSSIILLLNKNDIFDEKIMSSHLVDYFPDYEGPQKESVHAREFILKKFVDLNPNGPFEKIIYSHIISTIYTNTNQIRFVFSAVKDTIEQLNRLSLQATKLR